MNYQEFQKQNMPLKKDYFFSLLGNALHKRLASFSAGPLDAIDIILVL